MTTTNIAIHMAKTNDVPMDKRIRVRYQNYNSWATAMIAVDDHDFTVFLQSIESIREYAGKLAGLSHALFLVANEQELVARAKEQASSVG